MHQRRVASVAAFLMVALTAAACSTTRADRNVSTSAPAQTATNQAVTNQTVTNQTVRLTKVAALQAPVALVPRKGTDDLYAAELFGAVRRLVPHADGTVTVARQPVVDVHTSSPQGEQGLLGLAFSPAGDRLFVSFSDPKDHGNTVLASFAMKGDVADPVSRTDIMRITQPFNDHQGGSIAFGPDGYLYWALGDGGSAPDDPQGGFSNNNAQDLQKYQGKVLRIDPLHPSPGANYSVPADNPFATGAAGLPEIWAYGLRNPWRFSFDRQTGDVWIGDVGWEQVEEIDLLPRATGGGRGANLGWRIKEGTQPAQLRGVTTTSTGPFPAGLTDPVYEYRHPTKAGSSRAVIGGYVYRGAKMPNLRGAYLYGDFGGGGLHALRRKSDGTYAAHAVRTSGPKVVRTSGFGQDRHGELYVMSIDGAVLRLSGG